MKKPDINHNLLWQNNNWYVTDIWQFTGTITYIIQFHINSIQSLVLCYLVENPKSSENGNRIRGDRLSIADARLRREAESQNRLRRLSSLAPEEVNKVRRNSRNSSRQSSKIIFALFSGNCCTLLFLLFCGIFKITNNLNLFLVNQKSFVLWTRIHVGMLTLWKDM